MAIPPSFAWPLTGEVFAIDAKNIYQVTKRISALNTVVDVAVLQDPDYDRTSEYFPNLDWLVFIGTRGRMKKIFAYLGHPY